MRRHQPRLAEINADHDRNAWILELLVHISQLSPRHTLKLTLDTLVSPRSLSPYQVQCTTR